MVGELVYWILQVAAHYSLDQEEVIRLSVALGIRYGDALRTIDIQEFDSFVSAYLNGAKSLYGE